ncbi:DMT family transporter [Oscillatoria sp. FACHB-1407]|uniref:DMT family transporter n=1 Tax=Oscillatoria sp. FACHB-1407 TaxID=2692847 RepID=UPI001687BCD4|nr:DMT family transporter [Oscillatoria sp. FACHB-1407]MBD2461735.1 DMT family transporter [Oscillatoria sp. FACHB-1407]
MTSVTKPTAWQVGLILTLGIVSVSTAAIFIRLALAAADARGVGFSLVLAALRLTMAALLLVPAWRNFRSTSFQPNAMYYSLAAGGCLALHFGTWITSLSYTSIAASTTLVTTNPIWVALLSWVWFKEKPTVLTTTGIGVTLAGGVLVGLTGSETADAGSNPLLGNILALIGSWAVSLYFLLGREAQRRGLGIGSHAVLTYSTAALVLLPLPLLFNSAYTGYSGEVYLYIFLMALFPQAIGHTSFNWAVRWISPTLVTLVILAEPVGSGILGFIVFRENPGIRVLVGAVIILAGVAIAVLGSRKSAETEANQA